MIQFQEYLQNDYPGFASFIDVIIKPIFGDNFKAVENIDDMIDCLNEDPDELECYDEIEKTTDKSLKNLAEASGLERILKLGSIKVQGDTRRIYVYDITVNERRQLSRNRKGIQQLITRTLNNQSGAFMLFHYDDAKWEWRFSYKFVGKDQNDSTNSKRFTYLFGKNQVCKTAAQRFTNLLNKKCDIAIEDITEAFNVEALSKEFFDTYKSHYEHFCQFVYDNKNNRRFFDEEFSMWEDKAIRDYVKKLLGRIVFLHFLQKKGWMGVSVDKQWGEGDLKFMMNLYDSCSNEQKANYLDNVLEPLFEDLNTQRINDLAGEWSQSYSAAEEKDGIKIPYLNGGLFELEATDIPKSVFPADYFADLFDFFNQYNFTIDENDPNDAEVGIDPEMLGRIFENLLEDNKDKGAFYTPKEIVQYMCRESLIAYLQTDAEEESKESLRKFVTTHEVGELRSADVFKVDKKLREVKICDPAIGSGAFPMGLLKELFDCRMAIEGIENGKTPAEIKKDIIQNSIYGVDIEKGAVDIARLRFWLSLVIDEQTPHALPNMDFKIMQGNSLLEQYNGFDLSTIMNTKKKAEGPVQMTFFEEDVDKLRNQLIALRRAYFRETDKGEKKKLRQSMRQIVQEQINALSYDIILPGIDIAENSEFFLWHTWFSDVFENGGFDIVIGNPPYIRVQTIQSVMPQLASVYRKEYNDVASGNFDFYVLFTWLGFNLLNEKGYLSYIQPNKFFQATMGSKLRFLLKKNKSLYRVIDFGTNQVFNSATTYTCILFLSKNKQVAFSFKKFVLGENIWNLDDIELSSILIDDLPDDSNWTFENGTQNPIIKKIKKAGPSFKEITTKIFKGSSTGNDKIFLLNYIGESEEYYYVTSEVHPDKFKIEKSICRKFIYGENALRYIANESGKLLLFPYKRIEDRYVVFTSIELKEKYPEAYIYLEQNKANLFKRKVALKNESYFKYSAARSLNDYEQPKIMIPDMLVSNRVAYDSDGDIFMGPAIHCPIFKTQVPDYFYLGILNSNLFWYFITKTSTALRGDAYRMTPEFIDDFAFPDFKNEKAKLLINLVDKILSIKKMNPHSDTVLLEHEIDILVYQLYGLTEDEIQIVENKE